MIHTMLVNTPDGGALNMREQPSKSSGIIAKIQNGTPVGVVDEVFGWKKLEYNGLPGWVMEDYLIEPHDDPQGQIIVPKAELQRIYDLVGDWLGLRG